MSLLCSLGWHSPAGIPRWNDGFYFSTCARCGRDLVRTAYERWHVPKGFRVVWSDTPPVPRGQVEILHPAKSAPPAPAAVEAPPPPIEDNVAAAIEPIFEQEGPGQDLPATDELYTHADDDFPDMEPAPRLQRGSEIAREPGEVQSDPAAPLPIQALIDQLGESPPPLEDEDGEAPQAAEEPVLPPPSPTSPPAPTRRPSWDFMDDEPSEAGDDLFDPAPLGGNPPTGMSIPKADPAASAGEPANHRHGQRLREMLDGAPEPWKGLALAAIIGILVIGGAYFWIPGQTPSNTIEPPGNVSAWASPGNPAPSDSEASAPSRFAASARPQLYVTASLLSCRSAPSQEAQRVRNLGRGDQVELIARAPPWVSLSFRGRQCWALERYLAPVRPY